MKILYVCTTTDMGGAETALRALSLAVQKAGHTVRVVCLKPLGSVGKDMQEQGLDVVSLNLAGKWRPIATAGVLARLMQQIESFQPDVVHAFLYRAIMLCRLAKKHLSFKLITTPHYDLSRKGYLLRLLDRALKNADDISCAESRATADFLEKKQKYQTEKVRLVSNGVDLTRFRPDDKARQAARQQFGWKPEEIIFICVARLSAEKNHPLLLQAFASIRKHNPLARLVLVGDGAEKEKLSQWVHKKGLENAVVFAGEVSNTVPFLLASDVFVLVSTIESLPVSVLEACSCAKPCIVSKVGDMPRVVLHGQTGFLCNTQDPVLLSVLMAELAENETSRQQMGQAARQRIERYYPAPEKAYLKIYQELI